MSKTPGTLILLVITWTIFLVTGISLIWQAIMDKSSPTKSKARRIVNEIKFRLKFATGVVLMILFLSGVFWLLVKW
ncbi:MAG: hypothetical protein NTW99_05590 [Chloroflexi bacterium]|jgi:hypothetical protein|nr:hypothetical protein [Chloroflexota bacterium]